MSDLALARNCCKKPSWCRNEQVCKGRQKVSSTLSGPTDWILRYIKLTFFNYVLPISKMINECSTLWIGV